jgi:hypothetical protein
MTASATEMPTAVSNAAVADMVPQAVEEPPTLLQRMEAVGEERLEEARAIDSEALLAPMFDVVAEDTEVTAPHQVTAAEFQELVALIDRIRNGEGGLVIDDDVGTGELQALFETELLRDLSTILQTPSGRDLVTALSADHEDGRQTSFSLNNKTLLDGFHEPAASKVTAGGQALFTGDRTTIEVAPGVDQMAGFGDDVLMRSDVTLYHEMVHALGQMDDSRVRGRLSEDEAVIDADVGTAEEEYRATGLGAYADGPYSENRYRAERAAMAGQDAGRPTDADIGERPQYYAHRPSTTVFDPTEHQYNAIIGREALNFYEEAKGTPEGYAEILRYGGALYGEAWAASVKDALEPYLRPDPPRVATVTRPAHPEPEPLPLPKTAEEWAVWSDRMEAGSLDKLIAALSGISEPSDYIATQLEGLKQGQENRAETPQSPAT